MKLTFLGTRGEIDARTNRHRMHTSLRVGYRRRRVMIDCGRDWLGHLDGREGLSACIAQAGPGDVARVRPHAIVLTHAHPDHAWGLAEGAPCPVWATAETWEDVGDYPIEDRHTVHPREPVELGGITVEAFTVEHSTRCPAVGYRVTAGRVTIFYVPDLVYIHERAEALRGVDLYVGDGATLTRSMVRKRGDRLIGHTPVRTQLTWCQKEGVPRAIVTHCGSEIVEGDERTLAAELRKMAGERGVQAQLAHDGLEIVLR